MLELLNTGAMEMARRISDGAISAEELVKTQIDHTQSVNPMVNALVAQRFDEAIEEARLADELDLDARRHRPLHGVPITIKECFAVEGFPTTLGNRPIAKSPNAKRDSAVVERLRSAGAILLGKTNVSQLMVYNESSNPVFGRTANPWDDKRTSGGSSGGAAALLAARGTALDVGSDAGGSIRVPAHFCGVHAMMTTPNSISRSGMNDGIPGLAHVTPALGPMARRVEDLIVVTNLLSEMTPGRIDRLRVPESGTLRNMRFAAWPEHDYFSPSPAIQRAVDFASDALREAGANLVELKPPPLQKLTMLFSMLWFADGEQTVRRQLGAEVDPHVKRMVTVARLPWLARALYARLLRAKGDHEIANIVMQCRKRSVAEYWKIIAELETIRDTFMRAWQESGADVILCPPFGLPAIQHGTALDLFPPACFATWVNLFRLPGGSLSVTHVRQDEMGSRNATTYTEELASEVERQSAGLPVGVQIVAGPNCEQAIFNAMTAIEAALPPDDSPTRRMPPLAMV